jgi:light-regulated signal transduction histidine kinase (bacteriophytochrome)
LLGNAWKYTTRVALPSIKVLSSAAGSRRVLEVRDNGAGFDMTNANRLFAPFQRLHAEREFTGTGLGLASVRRIFERHGSRVWAEAAPNAGAAFFAELP